MWPVRSCDREPRHFWALVPPVSPLAKTNAKTSLAPHLGIDLLMATLGGTVTVTPVILVRGFLEEFFKKRRTSTLFVDGG